MGMKRTREDDAFIAEFVPKLKRAYESAKARGISDQKFAESIGVERAQLDRYLDQQSMPSVRTVILAYEKYHIAVPYRRISLRRALPKKARKETSDTFKQIVLPFTIETEKATARVDVKLRPISARKFALELTIAKAG
jgi:transcriptional regulator with XRE-family HTH domain